jgi:hypothetical protein
VGIILECLFLKPLLKYLNYELKKNKKVERITILSELCHCYLNSKQTPATEVRLKRRETAPKQLSSVLCTVLAAVCEPCQAKLSLYRPQNTSKV